MQQGEVGTRPTSQSSIGSADTLSHVCIRIRRPTHWGVQTCNRAMSGQDRQVKVASNQYYDGLSSHYHMFQQDWGGMVEKEREVCGSSHTHEAVIHDILDSRHSKRSIYISFSANMCTYIILIICCTRYIQVAFFVNSRFLCEYMHATHSMNLVYVYIYIHTLVSTCKFLYVQPYVHLWDVWKHLFDLFALESIMHMVYMSISWCTGV